MGERDKFSRRQFLRWGAIGLGSIALTSYFREKKINPDSPIKTPTQSLIEPATQLSPTPTKALEPEPTPQPEADHSQEDTPEKSQKVEIIMSGDVMLGRFVERESERLKDNTYPLRKIADVLRRADIVLINLENPVYDRCPESKSLEEMTFCSEPKMVDALRLAGVDIVTIANNHQRDYGPQGIDYTVSFLRGKGISVTGLGEAVIKDIKGTKFGFVGLDFVSREANEKDFELVRNSKGMVDVLIVSVHWGVEYTDEPTEFQREQAQALVASGADVIVGHHPHWVQEKELINGVPVYYSLGNLVFDQMHTRETREGVIVRLVFEGGKILYEEIIPTFMYSKYQPEFLEYP